MRKLHSTKVVLCILVIATLTAAWGATERVSVDSSGNQGNGHSLYHGYVETPAISADGRYVAFRSTASNLAAGDNFTSRIFVHDRLTGQTALASVNSSGENADSTATNCAISADGRYVAFDSWASNLVAEDTNGTTDVFVHNRQTGQTTRVSVSSAGGQGDGMSAAPSISADGRYVGFNSQSANLVPGDTNGKSDVFMHDRQTGQTIRVSVDCAGNQGNDNSGFGIGGKSSISGDGRYIAFASWADNLPTPGSGLGWKIIVHDRQTSQTTCASISAGGSIGEGHDPSISGDGRFVAFTSNSALVSGDSFSVFDIYVRDHQLGTTTLVSPNNGPNANNYWISTHPSISGDGRYVAFWSWNRVAPSPDPGVYHVFAHDRQTGQRVKVDVNNAGDPGNAESNRPALTADGRFVSYGSPATNLVASDTNGFNDVFVSSTGMGTANDPPQILSAPTAMPNPVELK